MDRSKTEWSIDPGLTEHYAAIGKAVVEAAVAKGERPNEHGELDVDVQLTLRVGERHSLAKAGGWQLCCVCTRSGDTGNAHCQGTCCGVL